MSFLSPFMLWGALAASIPIALHFFFRSRYRTLPWAAMKFLRTSIEQTSRRLKFQEWLLLAMRVLLLLLLALALARPSTRAVSTSDTGDAVDAVFVIDNSYSMDAWDGTVDRNAWERIVSQEDWNGILTRTGEENGGNRVTRLGRAKLAALGVLHHLPAYSTVQIISVSNRAIHRGPRVPSNFEQARQVIRNIEIEHRATDFLPAVNEAVQLLQRGQSPNKEVYLFSDMQTPGWERSGPALKERLQDVSRQAAVYLVRCGTRRPQNATIVDIAPQFAPPSSIPRTGERTGFAVLVRNTGAEPVRNLIVTLEIDGRKEEKEAGDLSPGETRPVTLTAKLDRPGLRVVTATVRSDDLDADNRFDQVIDVREQVRVLVVDGAVNEKEPEKSASYHLLHALWPLQESERLKYHIQPRVVTPEQAQPALLADKDVCILVNASLSADGSEGTEQLSPEFLERLAEFVREGHGLMIFSGDHVVPRAYNLILYEELGLLPAKLVEDVPAERVVSMDRAVAFDRKSAGSSYLKFLQDELYKIMEVVEVWRTVEVEEPPAKERTAETQVPLRYSNGRPAILTRRVGQGEVMFFTTSADASWTIWPKVLPGQKHAVTYLAVVNVSLSRLVQVQTQDHNQVASEPLVWHPPAAEMRRPFVLISPREERQRLGPAKVLQDRPTITATETSRAGVYRIVAEMPGDADDRVARAESSKHGESTPFEDSGRATHLAGRAIPFAVVPDPRETENLESLSAQDLDERLGIKAIHLTADSGPERFAGSERLNREWTIWVLLAVLILTLGEAGLAWLCGRAW